MVMIFKKEIGLRLLNLRKQKKLSMDEVASYVGVSGRSTINGWEKGRSVPKNEFLSKLSSLFNVSKEFILYGDIKHYVINILEYCLDNPREYNNLIENIKKFKSYANGIDGYRKDNEFSINNLSKDRGIYTDDFSDELIDKILTENHDHYRMIVDETAKNITTFSIDYDDTEKIIQTLDLTVENLLNNKIHTFEGQEISLLKYITENMDSSPNFFRWSFIGIDPYITHRKELGSTDIRNDIDVFFKNELSYKILEASEEIINELKLEYEKSKNKYL